MIDLPLEQINAVLAPLGVELIVQVNIKPDGLHRGTRLVLAQIGEIPCNCAECCRERMEAECQTPTTAED